MKLFIRWCFLIGICLIGTETRAGPVMPCPMTTYDHYIVPGFSCTMGGLTFSNFTLDRNSNIAADRIDVFPLGNGFLFEPHGLVADIVPHNPPSRTVELEYDVTSNNGINEASLTIGGVTTDRPSSAIADTFITFGNNSETLDVSQSNPRQKTDRLQAVTALQGPPMMIHVDTTATVRAGSGTEGEVEIRSIENRFGTNGRRSVPEIDTAPLGSAVTLLFGGLLLVGGRPRGNRSSQLAR
jgi:hypothetical protein